MDTITITFPQVKVKIPIKGLTFDILENMLFEILQNIARRVFEKAITDIDKALRNKRGRGKLKNTGKREKYFLTRFGDILYSRTRYKDKKTGKSCYLLDEALSIVKNQRISLSRARIENFLSALSSYREVVTCARLLLGNFRSHEAIRQSVLKEGKLLMRRLSLQAEERLSLSKVKKVIFGGDGDSWITSGIKEYFPNSIYLLCLYHLFKKFKECLPKRKEEQKVIKELLLSNQIEQALLRIDQMIRNPYDLKEKDNLIKLYTYISRNRQGISNQFKLKDKGIERTGAIESNIKKAIATRFKKRGMSWSKPGALALLKIKETVLNGEWDKWWETERERNIKVDKYKPPLPASYFKKEAEISPLIEVTIPAFIGPDQDKPWVGVLRKLSEAGYYN